MQVKIDLFLRNFKLENVIRALEAKTSSSVKENYLCSYRRPNYFSQIPPDKAGLDGKGLQSHSHKPTHTGKIHVWYVAHLKQCMVCFPIFPDSFISALLIALLNALFTYAQCSFTFLLSQIYFWFFVHLLPVQHISVSFGCVCKKKYSKSYLVCQFFDAKFY